jgi:hypothetical protein
MADLGYVGAGGTLGAMRGLADLIAQRQKEQILSEKRIESEREWALRQMQEQRAGLAEEEEIRQFDIQQNRLDRLTGAQAKYYESQTAENEFQAREKENEQKRAIAARDEGLKLINEGPFSEGEKAMLASYVRVNGKLPEGFATQYFKPSPEEELEEYRKKARITAETNAQFRQPPAMVFLPQWNPQTGTQGLMAVNPRAVQPGTMVTQTPPSVGMQQAGIEAEQSLGYLNDIQRLYKKEYVGPVQGTMNEQYALRTGYDLSGKPIDPQLAQFAHAVHANRDATIKMITGAAMNKEEAPRLSQQIPNFSQPAPVFEANLQGAIRHKQQLADRLRFKQGQGLETPGVAPIGADGVVKTTAGEILYDPKAKGGTLSISGLETGAAPGVTTPGVTTPRGRTYTVEE